MLFWACLKGIYYYWFFLLNLFRFYNLWIFFVSSLFLYSKFSSLPFCSLFSQESTISSHPLFLSCLLQGILPCHAQIKLISFFTRAVSVWKAPSRHCISPVGLKATRGGLCPAASQLLILKQVISMKEEEPKGCSTGGRPHDGCFAHLVSGVVKREMRHIDSRISHTWTRTGGEAETWRRKRVRM